MMHTSPGNETQKAESWGGAHGRMQGQGDVNSRTDRELPEDSAARTGDALPSRVAASPALATWPSPDHTV